MRDRSSLFFLMSKLENSKKSHVVREIRQLNDAHSRAEVLALRLREILHERLVTGSISGAELRSSYILSTKIAAEFHAQNERALELSEALDRLRQELAGMEYKSKYLHDVAKLTRAHEQLEAENKAEQVRPQPRR